MIKETKKQILIETARLIINHDYASISMQMIADKVKIRKASLFHHYTTKDNLLIDMVKTIARHPLDFKDLGFPVRADIVPAIIALHVRFDNSESELYKECKLAYEILFTRDQLKDRMFNHYFYGA